MSEFVKEEEEDKGEERVIVEGEGSEEEEAQKSLYTAASCRDGPVVVLVIGMAGSGKTTLMHRINLYMKQNNKKGYYINLDPGKRVVHNDNKE